MFHYTSSRGVPVVHVDLYRLERPQELWELGWEDLGSASEIALVEWPERAGEFLPTNRWEVELSVAEAADDLREVAVTRFGHPRHLPGFPVRLGGEEEEE
jgi:tRNA A37 threonylcarbamoyladenosine biosynthesis protein TsaE